MSSLSMIEVKKDLNSLDGKYETVLFGSQVTGGARPNSDIDIAILSRLRDREANIELQKELLGKAPIKYDLRVFELYPIHIQMSIINDYEVIFGDPLEISEYFYRFRKLWQDVKHRVLDFS